MENDSQTSSFPKLIVPSSPAEAADLAGFIARDSEGYRRELVEEGALLFRGFAVSTPEDFERVSASGTPDLVAYTGGGSPRKQVDGKVYTSTEYPKEYPIPLHCEESYFPAVPKNIWFFCETEPTDRGQTPLGCMQAVLSEIDPKLLEEFCEKGVRYIYNLHGGKGFGRGWKDAFLTEDRDWVTAWLEEHKAQYRWNPDDSLHMDLPGPALRTHSETGIQVWGNQVINWHVDALPPQMAKAMRRLYRSENEFPKHATFGDGSTISKEKIDALLSTLERVEVAFDWKQGDVLWCDNERIAHGRRPFTGPRRILVALS